MSGYETRKRALQPSWSMDHKEGPLGAPSDWSTTLSPLPGSQETYSFRTEGGVEEPLVGPVATRRNGFRSYDPVYDQGHEFRTVKKYSTLARGEVYLLGNPSSRGSSPTKWMRGPLIPQLPASFPVVASLSDAEWVSYGQRAINASAPTAPQVSAATFIGEIFAGLPLMLGASLWKSRLQDYRQVGSEYLNVQFGWKPFISEILDAVKALKNATAILTQLERDNGKNVRRRFTFPLVRTSEAIPYGLTPGVSSLFRTVTSTDFFAGSAISQDALSAFTVRERQMWFSGAFTYSIPTDSSLMGKLSYYDTLANKLLGTRVTPEVLWELAPWSWLVDWRLGIGNALSAANRFTEDGLVIRYGYMMCHQKATSMFTVAPIATRFGPIDRTPAISYQLTTELKERKRATPYGFGLNLDALSDTQWSILGALGMTRAPRKLL